MNEHRVLIFDLDGTLSDPTVGIGRSINHALAAFGYPAIEEQAVSQYIGPPLDEIFRRIVPGSSDRAVLDMVEKYRERYGVVGYAENVVYAGIPDALEHLSLRGARMGVCTSKRADFAEQVLSRLNLRHHFEFLSGGDVGVRKQDQLKALIAGGSVGEGSTMIGDRAMDIVAARANGLRSVAVRWGHGALEELRGAAPDRLLETPDELKSLVDSG